MKLVDVELQHEIEQFLYYEAQLLADREYQDWLDLFADDIHYWMPIRRTVTVENLHLEYAGRDGMAYFDDDRADLGMRVEKLQSNSAWSENPPSRTRHLVSNVRNAYWDYVFAVQSVDVAQQSVTLASQLVKDNQTRVEVGTMAPIDVIQAQSQAATQRQNLAIAQGTRALVRYVSSSRAPGSGLVELVDVELLDGGLWRLGGHQRTWKVSLYLPICTSSPSSRRWDSIRERFT